METKATCTIVNAFLRDVDIFLATKTASDIPCEDLKAKIYKLGTKYRHKKTERAILKTAILIWKRVMCKNTVTVNVAEIRRDLSRIRCDDTSVTLGPPLKNTVPIPTGFVIPREWPAHWTSEWASNNGWIRDPYYDWLEPANAPPPPPVNPRDINDGWSWTTWIIIAIIVVAVVATGYIWYTRRSSRKVSTSPSSYTITQTDIDREFLAAPPPTTLAPTEDQQGMPSTTDLMNDFQNLQDTQSVTESPKRSSTLTQ